MLEMIEMELFGHGTENRMHCIQAETFHVTSMTQNLDRLQSYSSCCHLFSHERFNDEFRLVNLTNEGSHFSRCLSRLLMARHYDSIATCMDVNRHTHTQHEQER